MTDEQKDELREFKETPAGKSQIALNAKRGQGNIDGGGTPSKKKKTHSNRNTSPKKITTKHAKHIAAVLGKIGEKDWKEDAKFEKGMTKLSLTFASNTAATVLSVGDTVASKKTAVADRGK